jgi:hypothetical protein
LLRLRQGVTMRGAYFPRGLWYSPYDGALAVDATDGGRYVNLTVRNERLLPAAVLTTMP